MSDREATEVGAPALVAPRQAHRVDTDALGKYLAAHGLMTSDRLRLRQFAGGQSNPTFLIESDLTHSGVAGRGCTGSAREDAARRYVLRKQPPGEILPSAHRIDREYRVMAALAHQERVPVPAMRHYCDDASVIGTPFYIMDYVPGRVFADPALPNLAPGDRTAIYHTLMDTLADLHAVAIQAVGLTDFGRPRGYIQRQIERWRGQYEASLEGEPDPAMDALGQWLAAHIPAESPPAIAHGDFRIGNCLFAPDTPRVVAVLDWELATLGHPLADLAYACMPYYLPHGVPGVRGIDGLDTAARGIPDLDGQLERYRARRGIGPIENWPVFVAFALFRTAAILQGVYARARQGNAASADAEQIGERAGLIAQRGWAVARAAG